MNHDSITYEYWLEVEGSDVRTPFYADLDSSNDAKIKRDVWSWATHAICCRIDCELLNGKAVRVFNNQKDETPYLVGHISVTTKLVPTTTIHVEVDGGVGSAS